MFVLCQCIRQLALFRTGPLTRILEDGNDYHNNSMALMPLNMNLYQAEQIVLKIKVMTLLSVTLSYGVEQLRQGRLKESSSVRKVLEDLQEMFRTTVLECKEYRDKNTLLKLNLNVQLTADILIYKHAIEMVCFSNDYLRNG